MTNVLSFELNKTAEWRDRKAERHMEDARNKQGAAKLRDLAEMSADEIKAEAYERTEESEDIAIDTFNETRSSVLSDIGFGFHPKHVDEVIDRILATVR